MNMECDYIFERTIFRITKFQVSSSGIHANISKLLSVLFEKKLAKFLIEFNGYKYTYNNSQSESSLNRKFMEFDTELSSLVSKIVLVNNRNDGDHDKVAEILLTTIEGLSYSQALIESTMDAHIAAASVLKVLEFEKKLRYYGVAQDSGFD